jgi:hypothetical protein
MNERNYRIITPSGTEFDRMLDEVGVQVARDNGYALIQIADPPIVASQSEEEIFDALIAAGPQP